MRWLCQPTNDLLITRVLSSSVGRASNQSLEGCGFNSYLELRNFFCVLFSTHITLSVTYHNLIFVIPKACIDECDDIAELLVDYGANIDAEDRELWTPLHASAACGNAPMVEYLVERGANVVALNLDGNLPVDLVEDDEDLKNYLFKEMDKHGKVICHIPKVMPLLEDKPWFPLLDYRKWAG